MAKKTAQSEPTHTEHDCEICGSSSAVEAPFARFYTADQPLHICTGCGFVYIRRRRSAAEIARNWSEVLYKGHYTTAIPAVKCRHVYVADFINARIGLKGARVVDIGAGQGQFLGIMRDSYQADCFGIEPSGENCQILADKGFEHFHGTIEDYAATGRTGFADIVTVVWTLENCSSCTSMLRQARALLKPGGHLVVATGSRILVPFKKPLFLYLNETPADTNSFRFSANSLRRVLHVCGFATAHINRYIDTDYLCVIARNEQPAGEAPEGDNFMEVHDFFERWHRDTLHHLGNKDL